MLLLRAVAPVGGGDRVAEVEDHGPAAGIVPQRPRELGVHRLRVEAGGDPPDGRQMYLADSARGLVRRYPVDPATGALGSPEEFVRIEDGSPDGMTVDAEGAVWIAVWGTGTVRRHLPDGRLDRTVRLPARQPAGVCLQGRTLHITTARLGLENPGPDDGALFSTHVAVLGLPAAPYRPDFSLPEPP
ncbi:SMP-30/gluconolactonase/LRE family protein [Streptomyces pseudogriseolus]|uniref:SMP-30/gluconolactonase/LRE family protein n=1 Tax=Streptomyces pseudogriseolus TaxID=36817 RepID=UPI003FA2CD26